MTAEGESTKSKCIALGHKQREESIVPFGAKLPVTIIYCPLCFWVETKDS